MVMVQVGRWAGGQVWVVRQKEGERERDPIPTGDGSGVSSWRHGRVGYLGPRPDCETEGVTRPYLTTGKWEGSRATPAAKQYGVYRGPLYYSPHSPFRAAVLPSPGGRRAHTWHPVSLGGNQGRSSRLTLEHGRCF